MENEHVAPAEAKPPVWAETSYPLLFPIALEGGVELRRLLFREPNGEVLEAIEELGLTDGKDPTIKQALGLIRAMSGQPKAVTDRMHKKDIMGASEILAPLLA